MGGTAAPLHPLRLVQDGFRGGDADVLAWFWSG
ncbi:hypothetical protein GTY87_00330 [Streptomyces sp. SID7813]|uniref:Uncharacterized protein n=1 Tax=Streptomyces coelicolor (strain ATCC BAA-471 / A3(2) / M145) TaxID=100226 RepID=Q9RIA1_STRCO|nr:hypothetical protein [Streptomyces sp. SID7813]QFI40398.1 hypothetical protein FQ762_00345 [Streptomyces coelicolor A3(2)]THA83599.1 hypothetical protein E6R61_34165 [Streptomyces sp. LRa12]CAB52888.1 hypothetical protein [Streptomyces coelicolor A3(2)]